MTGRFLTIGQLAREAKVNLETVRYYERRGLLAKPPRTHSGYRLFPSEATQRLRFIRHAQDLGFSLTEIRELLALRISPKVSKSEVRKRAQAKILDIEKKITRLESMRASLHKLTISCNGCGPVSECPILESLAAEDA